MKVDYDSEGHSILFEFGQFREREDGDYTKVLAGGVCIVWFHDDRPESIQLLGADEDISPLDSAAEEFGLDVEGLRAAAHAALAAPDREIHIEIGKRLPLGDEEQPEAAVSTRATPRSG